LRTMDRSYTRMHERAIRSSDEKTLIHRYGARPCRAEHLPPPLSPTPRPEDAGLSTGRLRRIHETTQRHIEPPDISDSVMRVGCRITTSGPYESFQKSPRRHCASNLSAPKRAWSGANQHRRALLPESVIEMRLHQGPSKPIHRNV
jgi:hypothetical protein